MGDLVRDLAGDLNKVATNHGFDSHPERPLKHNLCRATKLRV